MSKVTSVTLICSVVDRHSIDDETVRSNVLKAIDAWLIERRFPLLADTEVSAHGSGKVMECAVMCKAYNYFDADEFGKFIASLDWICPENVVLIMQPEETATIIVRPDGYWTDK